QTVALQQVAARTQVELPAVPVAGEHTGIVERSLAQGVALMRTAVVAGEDRIASREQGDLLAPEPCHGLAVTAQPFERHGGNPAHGIPSPRQRRFGADSLSNRLLSNLSAEMP